MKKKIYRWAFVSLWFILVPLGLTLAAVSGLSGDGQSLAPTPINKLQWFVTEQKVPALIIFFVAFETLIYGFRYALPFADKVGVAGRPGLPKDRRRDFEQASQLLDEVHQLLKKNKKDIEGTLSEDTRNELDVAMRELADAMDRKEFSLAQFEQAHARASELAGKHLTKWQRGEVREYTESILIAVGIALLLRAFVVEAFKIPSGSMLPTLQISDHIFVNKFTYGPTLPFSKGRILSSLPPDRGDIVVFEYPDDNNENPRQDFIKRTIALPGDMLETRGGHPVINGWEVPHCRVGSYTFGQPTGYPTSGELFVEVLGEYSYLTLYENYQESDESLREGPYVVKPGEFWVLGDNRNSSSDSRRWRQGRGAGVPFPNVKGRAMFVWLSFDDTGAGGVTWDRLFTNVMGTPRLPKEAPGALKKGIEKCLKERPTDTNPPPPHVAKVGARGHAIQ